MYRHRILAIATQANGDMARTSLLKAANPAFVPALFAFW